MDYQFLHQLLALVEQFEAQTHSKPEMAAFGRWLQAQDMPRQEMNNSPAAQDGKTPEVRISQLLFYIYRYARGYTKQALADSVLVGGDDFVYLIMLEYASLTKTELIYANRHEKTSGMEIIKRLLAQGLILQDQDAQDLRRRRLHLTEAGRAVLAQVRERMSKVSRLVSGNLSEAEKAELVRLLERLEDFHAPRFGQKDLL